MSRNHLLFVVGTLLAWIHTVDEIVTGEYDAVLIGVVNLVVALAWPRLRRGWQAAAALLFGLLWTVGAIAYHLVNLFGADATRGDYTSLTRVIGGLLMLAVAAVLLGRRRPADRSLPEVDR